MKRKAFKAAFPYTLPILAGFSFLGMAYGIYMNASGFSFIYPLCMSFLIFGMCDETFSVNYTADIPEGIDQGWFMFFVTLLDQLYWGISATLGALLGSLLKFDTNGISFVMTAMFVVIFLEQWFKEKDHTASVLGLAVAALCLILFGADAFMIPTMLLILIFLAILRKKLEKKYGNGICSCPSLPER